MKITKAGQTGFCREQSPVAQTRVGAFALRVERRELIKLQFAQRPEEDKKDMNCHSPKFADFQRGGNDTASSKPPGGGWGGAVEISEQTRQCLVLEQRGRGGLSAPTPGGFSCGLK